MKTRVTFPFVLCHTTRHAGHKFLLCGRHEGKVVKEQRHGPTDKDTLKCVRGAMTLVPSRVCTDQTVQTHLPVLSHSPRTNTTHTQVCVSVLGGCVSMDVSYVHGRGQGRSPQPAQHGHVSQEHVSRMWGRLWGRKGIYSREENWPTKDL